MTDVGLWAMSSAPERGGIRVSWYSRFHLRGEIQTFFNSFKQRKPKKRVLKCCDKTNNHLINTHFTASHTAPRHHGCKRMSKDTNNIPLILSGLNATFPWDKSELNSLISNDQPCQDTMVISRKMLPFYLPCREVGQDGGVGGEWEQTVGLVCCCVLPCLGFHRPDDYRLIPGDSFLTQEILPSARLTELISLL